MDLDSSPSSTLSPPDLATNITFASGIRSGIVKLSSDSGNRYHIGDLQLSSLRPEMEVKPMFAASAPTSSPHSGRFLIFF